MTANGAKPDAGDWDGCRIEPGERRSIQIIISESYSGMDVKIPLFVWRGREPGPTVFVTAAVHGDEINGTGAIRHIIVDKPFTVNKGTLILVPVVNLLGFDQHSRYLPDRRDLNRCFPGMKDGSLASRLARAFFDQVVARCDYGIDLHTAAVRRTNFPNVRADMARQKLAAFARAFGAELIVNCKGPKGSLRRSACGAGCPTLILEAGEVWKAEQAVLEYAVRGIRNCLIYLGMVEGEAEAPPYRVETDVTKWVRARHGGFLQFHVAPGDIVDAGEALATNTSLTGEEQHVIASPLNGVVLGMTTLPSVAPGDPICLLAFPKAGVLRKAERAVKQLDDESLHMRMREDLARSLHISDIGESEEGAGV